MKKLLVIAVVLSASVAQAKDPCGVELCMGGMTMMREEPEQCREHISDFFDIVKYKNGHFSPSKTKKARTDFLDQCESGNANDKKRIIAKYGTLRGL